MNIVCTLSILNVLMNITIGGTRGQKSHIFTETGELSHLFVYFCLPSEFLFQNVQIARLLEIEFPSLFESDNVEEDMGTEQNDVTCDENIVEPLKLNEM